MHPPLPSPPTLVIIPAYNEAAAIAQVVAQVRHSLPGADVCVIDDGSADETASIARAAGAITLRLPYNVGIGAAVQTGYIYAYRAGYDVAVRIDGDDQHPPAAIPALLAALAAGDDDMVIGSRFLAAPDVSGPDMSGPDVSGGDGVERCGTTGRGTTGSGYRGTLSRRIGIVLLSRVIGLLTGETVTDPTSGFLVANRRAIAFCAHEYPHDYPEPEARVLMHRGGLRVREVPVVMRERAGGVSSITTLRSVYYMSKVLLALALDALRMPRQPEA